ncbi:hypothetical protein IB276_10695 [Ensifer sp. ENS04]|uniref:phage tail fiber protein n=1 Tax=Ensifer sp. ENS04 TaxID=2769281 RepID=UPI001781FE4B|nr:hypothetical protein [Ensifer sp. ENS04]MBD9539922.1 hypothetical protein [Ensifer sp. ENS04]
MALSTYAANAMINLLLRGVAYTAPARVYVSLHTANPGNTGASEVTTVQWPSYARQDPAQGGAVAGGFLASTAKATENLLDLLFANYNGAGSLTISHFAIWDAATAGNCLWTGSLTVSKTLQPDDEAIIYPGDLDLSVS